MAKSPVIGDLAHGERLEEVGTAVEQPEVLLEHLLVTRRQIADLVHLPMAIVLVSRYSSKPSMPFWRPTPLAL